MLAGKPNGEARKQANELFIALDVEPRAKAMPSQLSGGEQQRVAAIAFRLRMARPGRRYA